MMPQPPQPAFGTDHLGRSCLQKKGSSCVVNLVSVWWDTLLFKLSCAVNLCPVLPLINEMCRHREGSANLSERSSHVGKGGA